MIVRLTEPRGRETALFFWQDPRYTTYMFGERTVTEKDAMIDLDAKQAAEAADPMIPSRYTGHLKDAYRDGYHSGYKNGITRAADLLEQLQAAPVPVAISDRLPQPEDCDVGRCYWGRQVNSRRWSWTFSIDPQGDTHWLPATVQQLPANILPLPGGEVEA